MTTRNVTSARLRDALLEEFINRIENGETVMPKGADDPVTISAPASTLAAATAFLKQFPPDDGAKGALSEKLKQYSDDMPFK